MTYFRRLYFLTNLSVQPLDALNLFGNLDNSKAFCRI